MESKPVFDIGVLFVIPEWPILGGHLPEPDDDDGDDSKKEYEILLTGHEDGSVKFWDCSGIVLKPLLHVKTASLFG
jgi:lethal(2) giant larvae protein